MVVLPIPVVHEADVLHVLPLVGAFAESLLESDPEHAEAAIYFTSCRDGLAEAYLAAIGGREAVPRVRVTIAALPGLRIDTFEAYVLSCVDGCSSVEDIVDVVGKPDHETLRALVGLLTHEAIRM